MSLESNFSLLDRARAASIKKLIPLQASLELTNRCNERCTHCYIEKFEDDQKRVLDLAGWEKVLDELRAAGTLYVILMGGEAMLNPLFMNILRLSVQKGFHTSMISNGQKIRSFEKAQELAEAGIANITFSLYSHLPEIHDAMTRVKGSHRRTTQTIDWCLEAGIDANVNCLMTRENINGVFELERWCLDRNIELKVDPMITPKLNGDTTPTLLRPSDSQLKWFYRERVRRWSKGIPQASIETENSYVCNAAKGKCAVSAYGELLPCIEIREPLGNLVTESFESIWQTETAKKWRGFLVKDLKDYPLTNGESFCDHCPGMAKNEDGDPMQVSSYARTLAKIKNDVRKEFRDQQS